MSEYIITQYKNQIKPKNGLTKASCTSSIVICIKSGHNNYFSYRQRNQSTPYLQLNAVHYTLL